MTDVLTASQRRYCMSRIRGSNTKPEITLRKALWSYGLRYRVKNRLPGHPDIVFHGRKTAIFVDGCFWHMCPKHFSMPANKKDFWKKKLERNTVRDRETTLVLRKQGWKVLRFWEHEVEDHLESCVGKVRTTLLS